MMLHFVKIYFRKRCVILFEMMRIITVERIANVLPLWHNIIAHISYILSSLGVITFFFHR